MEKSLLATLLMFSFLCSNDTSCHGSDRNIQPTSIENHHTGQNMTSDNINIKVGSKVFAATLFDNSSAKAFKEMLPLTINMTELNGNEKYGDLSKSLPINSVNPGTIKNGDLMLYGSNTLVLFYKSFFTSYRYTKLGTVDDATGLALALGSGNISLLFEGHK
ncbi:cyclophilin-like fold protein [Chitinophaga sp.]|uniref:cyclophilin-like fold protein n=1 Tax=Chitinophaga sp. TaxID=1869181 RepID=UPI002F9491D2